MHPFWRAIGKENSLWRKIVQIQPMRHRISSLRRFEKTFENSHWKRSSKCNQCDYASVLAGNLRRHLKTHSVEKSFICNQCDFTSLHLDDLRKHLKTPTGKKSLKCNQCVNAFVQTGSLP